VAAAAAGAGGAQAADLPLKVPSAAPPVAAPWAGWYVGGNVGAAYQQGTTQMGNDPNFYGYTPISNTTNNTSFIGGGQIGYNWQDGNFVYGLEADISGLTGGGGKSPTNFDGKAFSNSINWLSTVRLRGGLAVGNTMVYATGGLAIGGVKNSFLNSFNGFEASKSQSRTAVGWAVGGGVEHILWNSHWTIGLEGLFVDLGQSNVTVRDGKTAKFSNEAIIGRLKVNYKF